MKTMCDAVFSVLIVLAPISLYVFSQRPVWNHMTQTADKYL